MNSTGTLDDAELRVKEQAHASGRVTGRKNDLPSHVADLDDVAVINRLIDFASRELIIVAEGLHRALDVGSVDFRSNDGCARQPAQLSRGTHVIVMAVGEDDGVELLLAKLLKCADDDVGIAGRIDHDGGCIVGDDVDVASRWGPSPMK